MKTRFWKKAYLFTLILFLGCLNAAVLSLTVYSYRRNVAAAEETAKAEEYYIAFSFDRDLSDIGDSPDYSARDLMEHFGENYSSRGRLLAFLHDGDIIYSDVPEGLIPESDTVSHVYFEGVRHIVIRNTVFETGYELVFAKDASDLDADLRSLGAAFAITASLVSVLLAVSLYFVMRRLSVPIDRMREATEQIAGGNWDYRAEEKGNDEFALLAGSFNLMLEKIGSQMDELEREAENRRIEAEKKQTLINDMAHEMRTPLTSIRGYAETIEKAAIPEQTRIMAAKYIISESDRLGKISETILEGAYMGAVLPETGRCDLAAILADTVRRLSPKAEKAGVTFETDLCPGEAEGNPTLLSMLFYNLAENAIKACLPGGKVILSCAGTVASVSDDGRGMTKEQLSHITEPFYRTDKSRSRSEGGAGLGLSLCKKITEVHGALLSFESEPGKGTRATVEFREEKREKN